MSKQRRTYTVIVWRPDYVSDDQITDTYMTSLKAFNAAEAGKLAREEAASEDSVHSDPDDQNDPDDYVVVATMRGQHSDITGREDL